ncbi:MAG: capsular biosynthesis protein [Armatimonadetes bacterium]|nr:capsular biosynthesis protein [Armatimonadota bacterium]
MARLAVAGGTDTMVATPHRAWLLRREAPPAWVRPQVADLQAALDRAGIPLAVLPGVEIQVGPRVASELKGDTLGTLGDGQWALIEPPFDRVPHDGLDNIKAVLDAGFQIVLAHPERNKEIQQHLGFVEACADLGLTFQLTTGSLLGRFGARVEETAKAILARAADWPLVIASDTHDTHDRTPGLMAAARAVAAEIVGEEEAGRMVDARPRAIVFGR